MTATTAPTWNQLHDHGGLGSESGYDVIRTISEADGHLIVVVTAVTEGSTSYLEALTLAKAHRTAGPGVYGYPAARYACGCRWIANNIEGDRVEFIDL